MEKILQVTKAAIAKIWPVLKAKSIAALEKYVSVSRFDHKYYSIYVSCMYNFNTFNTVHSLQVATLVHSCLYTIILNDPQEKSSVSMLITLHDTSVLLIF